VFGAAEAVIALPATLSIAAGAAIISFVDFRTLYLLGAVTLLAGAVTLMRGRRDGTPTVLGAVLDGTGSVDEATVPYAAEDSISGA
jgi:hypothetical protein